MDSHVLREELEWAFMDTEVKEAVPDSTSSLRMLATDSDLVCLKVLEPYPSTYPRI